MGEVVSPNVGNLNMKLTGRWFPQIVDRDSGNLYPIYIHSPKKVKDIIFFGGIFYYSRFVITI